MASASVVTAAPGSGLPRVLYVITDLEVGGVPLHLLRLAGAARAAGACEVTVASLKPPGPVGERLREAGIAVRTCGVTWAVDWRAVERLAGIIGEVAPDVVHAMLFHANLAARLAGVLSGFPSDRIVCEIQTVEIERPWHLRVERWTHRLSRWTIGNSPSVIQHLHATARIPRSGLRLVLGGVDVDRFAAAQPRARAGLGVGPHETLLLWVGRMDPVKGLDTLIAAAERVCRQAPVKLLLAGDGPERERVEADIARRGLGDCVRLLGRRDDVPSLLRAADLFVFPSRTEGFPNALLEAMAAGTPVLASNVAGCRDLVTDGVTGRLVPADNVPAWAQALLALIRDRSTAAALARAAQAFVTRTGTSEACHRRYFSLYAEMLGETPGTVG